MWLHWGRGRNVPAHCTALLQEGCGVDLGVPDAQPPPAGIKQRTSPQKSSFERMLQTHIAEASAARTALFSRLLHAAALFAWPANVPTGWTLQMVRLPPGLLQNLPTLLHTFAQLRTPRISCPPTCMQIAIAKSLRWDASCLGCHLKHTLPWCPWQRETNSNNSNQLHVNVYILRASCVINTALACCSRHWQARAAARVLHCNRYCCWTHQTLRCNCIFDAFTLAGLLRTLREI